MKNNLFFILAFATILFFGSCTDKEDNGENNYSGVYGKENFYLTTHPEMVAPEELDQKEDNVGRFHLIVAFTEWGRKQMFQQTYISFEMYTDNQLSFIEDATDNIGGMWLSDIVFKENDEWQDRLNYPWYQMTTVSASGEGEFEFAVKFYYPEINQTFITSRYRMKLWNEDGKFRAETTLIE